MSVALGLKALILGGVSLAPDLGSDCIAVRLIACRVGREVRPDGQITKRGDC